MIIKHNFKAHLSKIKLRWNFSNFWTKSWVNPFETIPICPLCKIDIFSSRKAFFLSGWSANIIWRPIFVQKQSKRKIPIFYRNHGLIPLKKFSMATMWNPYCCSPGGLVFLTSRSIYLVTCWLHDILIYLLNYCSTGISTYWLNT